MTDDRMDDFEPLDASVRAALTPERVRAGTRARLIARAAADAESRGLKPAAAVSETPGQSSVIPIRPRQNGVSRGAFGAVAIALAATIVLLVKVVSDRNEQRTTFVAADREKTSQIDSLRRAFAARDSLVGSLTGPSVRVIGLTSSAAKNPRALMFWDKARDRWTFVAHDLPALPANRTYQLWLVTPTQKISAGTFNVTAGGDAFVEATYPLDPTALQAVAVTEEPAGGVPQPTGSMVVVGAAGQK
jgi:anti-sigma-K factor RskA